MGKSRLSLAGLFRVPVILASGGLLAACAVDPLEPTPISTTKHTMTTDIAGLVDLGGEEPTRLTTEIPGPIQDTQPAVHTVTSTPHRMASNRSHRSVIASLSHRKSPRQVAARPAPARKQAKVSAETRAAGPKT